MSEDILHHKPARPSTVMPGYWLINLPPDCPIRIQRYRLPVEHTDNREQALLEDPLEVQWRTINSSGDGVLKDILAGGCATIIDGGSERERELWVFSTSTAPDSSSSLEHVLPDPRPITSSELLECSRHGSNLSCLSQPSTSQRPNISCDVHFEPRGEERVGWERLGLAILEKAEWKRGKRVVARASDLQLLPDLNGLMLKVKTRKRSTGATKTPKKIQVIQPLGIPAIPIGPYRATAREVITLASSFDQALGPSWRDGQSALRLDAQLTGRIYWEYTTLWIPKSTSRPHTQPSLEQMTEWKKHPGLLAIWPTHLLDDIHDLTREAPEIRTVRDMPAFETSVDLLGIASGLFDSVSTYMEPVNQLTPPGDTSLEAEALVEPDNSEASPIFPWPSPRNGNAHNDANGHDDLEDLFASPTSPHSDANQHFEMFGDDDDHRISMADNAQMIDYDDVVMASPPQRRESMREVMGDVDEAGPGLVTDDDFNFFDSPPDPDAVPEPEPTPALLMPTPESLSYTAPAGQTPASEQPTVADVEITPPEPPSPVVELPHTEASAAAPAPALEPPAPVSPVSPELPIVAKVPKRRRTRAEELIPLDFAPLDLAHLRRNANYRLPARFRLPPKLNLDLIERLKGPYKKDKKHDYSLAWRLDASDTESDTDEYTRPPTPISDHDDTATPSIGPSPPFSVALEDVDGQSNYHYKGQRCIAAGLHTVLSRVTRPDNMYVQWQAIWGEDSPAGDLESLVTLPTKRTETGSKGGASSLSILAKQIIQNRHVRQMFRTSRMEGPGVGSGLGEEGVNLSDLARISDIPLSLPPCSIHTGFQGNVIQLSGASLRYWSELGLQPLSGPKTMKIIIVTRHAEDEARARALADSLRTMYSYLNLGTMNIDLTHGRQGYQFIGEKESLPSRSGNSNENTVTLLLLRNDRTPPMDDLLMCLPETAPNQATHILPLSLETRDIPDAARDIYNAISHQVRLVHSVDEPAPWHNYPTFTLAPTERPKPKLTMAVDWPISSYDVFGFWRWIHAAYTYDEETDTLVMFVMDAEGDDWDVRVETGLGNEWRIRAQTMWNWICEFGNSAAIEWRALICSLGIMGPDETYAWRSIFIAKAEPITVMMCDPSPSTFQIPKPKSGPANVPQSIFIDPSTTIIDESHAGAYLPFSQRQPIPSSNGVVYSTSSFLLSLTSSNCEYKTSTYHLIWHRPVPGTEEDDVDRELASEMYRLACWGEMRFGLDGLPGPLAAVDAVRDAFSGGAENDYL